jgi:hypothetical protein
VDNGRFWPKVAAEECAELPLGTTLGHKPASRLFDGGATMVRRNADMPNEDRGLTSSISPERALGLCVLALVGLRIPMRKRRLQAAPEVN